MVPMVGTFPSVPVPCADWLPAAAGALCSELGWVQLGSGAWSRTDSLGQVLCLVLSRPLSGVWFQTELSSGRMRLRCGE